MSTTLEDRFILILRDQISTEERNLEEHQSLLTRLKMWLSPPAFPNRGVWEVMERRTGISSQSWRGAYSRRQKPTTAMVEALAKLFPRYAFWLVTGITDSTNGHVAPMTALTFPERLYGESMQANEYFRTSIDLMEELFRAGNIDEANEVQRMEAVERTMPLAHWVGGSLLPVAYKLAETEMYMRLIALWPEREKERQENIRRITGEDRPWVARREAAKAAGVKMEPILGEDPMTKHQDHWDLFYIPRPKSPQKN